MYVSFFCYLFPAMEHCQALILRSIHIILKHNKGVEKDGEFIVYHKNGKPQSVGHFVKGVAHGPIIVYDSNGHELYRGLFTNGKPSGEWVFTNPKNHEKTIKSY